MYTLLCLFILYLARHDLSEWISNAIAEGIKRANK